MDIPILTEGMTYMREDGAHITGTNVAIMCVLNTGTNVAIMCAKALLNKKQNKTQIFARIA